MSILAEKHLVWLDPPKNGTQGDRMKRRKFIGLIGSAAVAIPFAAGAQRMPVIGFLSSRTDEQAEKLLEAVRIGLQEAGYVEGQNVTIEYRFANNQNERLPGLAADLVARGVAVIVAGGTPRPAMDATSTIPVVFTTGFDPVATGLVKSLNKPEANVTGATFYSGALVGKQAQALRELVTSVGTIGLLIHATQTSTVTTQIASMQAAVIAVGCEFIPLYVHGEQEFEAAFDLLSKHPNSSLIVSVDPVFDSHRNQLIALADKYGLPTVYYLREFANEGGLLSYGASILDTYRQAGIYAGRILKGAKVSELPVQLPTRFELVINLKTARKLGLTVPAALSAAADAVIE
jgi:ABC-type uncharacterized transport system substrate-binding protein